MKVDQKSLAFIQNVVETANLVKIDSIIIDPTRVRGLDEKRSVLMFHETDVAALPFGSVGLNRLSTFTSRFEVAKTCDNLEITAVVETGQDDSTFARALTMKAKGIKIDYRCANPATIQLPKALNDTFKYKVALNAEAVLMLQKGQTAMEAEEVSIIGTEDDVSFEMSDVNSDKLSYTFGGSATVVGGEDGELPVFTHKYPVKILTALFKKNPEANIFIGARGMLKIAVNNLTMIVLPRS